MRGLLIEASSSLEWGEGIHRPGEEVTRSGLERIAPTSTDPPLCALADPG